MLRYLIFFGKYGAIFADLFLQIFGFSSFIFAIIFISIGFRVYFNIYPSFLIIRIFSIFINILSLSSFLSSFSVLSNSLGYSGGGGLIGNFINSSFLDFLTFSGLFDYAEILIKTSSLLIFILSAIFGFNLTKARFINTKNSIFNFYKNLLPSYTEIVEDIPQPQLIEDNEIKKRSEKPTTPSVSVNKKPSRDASSNKYEFPPTSLLSKPTKEGSKISGDELKLKASQLRSVLEEFGIKGDIVKICPGPVVTLFELEPASGTKTARVVSLADDIAREMSAVSVRIAVVPGKSTIGIELPNFFRQTVYLRELFEDGEFKSNKNPLFLSLGKDIGGKAVYADLAKMPHLLIAGTTGSGKSVAINSMILSILYRLSPENCRLILIDPKMLEFTPYNGIPHLLTPVVTDPGKAVVALKWAVREMEDRYRAMSQMGVRNIDGYNEKLREAQKSGTKLKRVVQTGFIPENRRPIYEEQELGFNFMPYIVIIVDEMADLRIVDGKDVESSVQRLAQMARAAGIHLIMSTQRPSVDVITGTIKANFPTRISLSVTSKIDSRTILGEMGAEQLLGRGDMLYMPSGQRPIRVHGPFVSDLEVEEIVNFLISQGGPDYSEDITSGSNGMSQLEVSAMEMNALSGGGAANGGYDEDLYQEALSIVLNDKKASTSYIQRRLKIGYNKAANLIERMEREGIISPPNHVGKREIL
jgi:S-DNA-T family DNA segregation ATPase FtsK/SpoIIIE